MLASYKPDACADRLCEWSGRKLSKVLLCCCRESDPARALQRRLIGGAEQEREKMPTTLNWQLIDCLVRRGFREGAAGQYEVHIVHIPDCGKKYPSGIEARPGDRCVSFDGDADRLIYFFNDGTSFQMLVSPSW